MSGGYHYLDHSGSTQELIGPRHRLPIIAAPRPPISSHSTSTNAQQPPWMNKHSTPSNYHENPGFYGHSTVARDYGSISRAHCNESSAWSNPNFSNPLSNPPFGALTNKNAAKNEIQKESMDLSASHITPAVKPLAVNGDSQELKNHLTADSKKDLPITNSSVTVDRKPDVDVSAPTAVSVSDNVEFALESLFNSDTSAVPAPSQNPMCVESVEKILKSPDGSDDELTILCDSHDTGNVANDAKAVGEKPELAEIVKQNCDCNVKTAANASDSNCDRLNDVMENAKTCDTDRISSEASSRLQPVSLSSTNPAQAKPCIGDEETTFVRVENELEKMFAGIEDSDPLAPASLSATSDAQRLSLNHTANLFDSVAAKSSKKKASKKSKPSASKSMKDKQKSSSSWKESSSLDTMKRVPVIHIEGSKENPISAHIINSIKSEEDDVSDGRTSTKRKLGKSDRAVKKSTSNFAIKKYDPATSDATWVCIFCNLCAHAPSMAGEATGDLFGPYFIRTPEQIHLDESKIHSWRTTHLEQVKKKQKRSLSIESGYMDLSTSDEQKSLEVWAHENCIVWASGVHLIGSKLIGLEEAVMQALETICAHCSNKGASIGCQARHCNSCAHYSCAVYTGWKLDSDTFISTCSVHSVPLTV